MRATPSDELIDLLSRLALATAADLRRVARRARWLAGDLTHFDSVWVDALVQAEKLTPFQAAELNAGRGEALRVGRFALLAPLGGPAWTRAFIARVAGAAASREYRLVTMNEIGDTAGVVARLSETIRRLSSCPLPQVAPIAECGAEGSTVWAAALPIAGRPAAEWLVHSGRMTPDVVLEIARQMAIGLLALERAGVAHGDISTQNVVLDPIGVAQLAWPGLRAAVRPVETAEETDWPAEAYDHLAPERMRGAPASTAADLYSCGIVWRHLLSGRPPFAPVRAAAKLCAAQRDRLEAISHLAPDTPPALAAAITACESRDVTRRPESVAELVEMLGPSTDRGQALVAQYLSRGATPPERLARRIRTIRRSKQLPTWSALAAGVIFALAVGTAPWWASRLFGSSRESSSSATRITQQTVTQKQPAAGSPAASRSSGTTSIATSNGANGERRIAAAVARNPQTTQPSMLAPNPKQYPEKRSSAARAADPANYVDQATALQPMAPADAVRGVSPEFLLSAARPTAWSSVQPLAGQAVKGRPGERPKVVIPAAGALLGVEGVRFSQIDFVSPAGERPANLRVTARSASFDDCTFGDEAAGSGAGVSIVWTPRDAEGSPAAPAELQFARGAFTSAAAAAISCMICDEARLTLTDVLHLGAGPLVRVERAAPKRSIGLPTSLALRMTHCTSRGADALIEVAAPKASASTPRVRVESIECVFAPEDDGTLLLVRGGAGPTEALRQVAWSGQGSVVTPGARPVAWQAEGSRQQVADDRLAIEGLVRSELGFAGEANAGREASLLIRWQVPLRSTNPPGILEVSQETPRYHLR